MSFDDLFDKQEAKTDVTELNVHLTEGAMRFNKNALLEEEVVALANLRYSRWIKDDFENNSKERAIMISLERFQFARHCAISINGKWTGWAWRLSDKGVDKLDCMKPLWYGCRCEHAIRLQCVCNERTYCPNPEHYDNGCHGSHD